MASNNILTKVEHYCATLLQQLPSAVTAHNYERAKSVAQAVRTIGAAENQTEDDLNLAIIAVWFQYVGLQDTYQNYITKSKETAQSFLKKEGMDAGEIKQVLSAMDVAAGEQEPGTDVEKVLLDARKDYLLNGDYKKYNAALRSELSAMDNKMYTDTEWMEHSLSGLLGLQFYTAYGKELLEPVAQQLRRKLEKQKVKLLKSLDSNLVNVLGVSEAELKAMKKKLVKAEGRPERGIETMFRLTSKNHLDLSGMADSKANIMISVNSIILSILIGGLLPKLDSNTHLVAPTIILLIVNLMSMICSIISIRPNVTDGLFTREDIDNQRTNLLFFGNFHKMTREDYHWGMNQLMDNSDYLYSSLIDDIYFLGVVLAKKYRFLRYSYNIFMIGIVIAVVAFVIANFMANAPLIPK